MSRVLVLAANRQMPKAESGSGFFVEEEEGYYQDAISLEMGRFSLQKYFRFFDISPTEEALADLQAYLERNMQYGERVELWSIYLGGDSSKQREYLPAFSHISRKELQRAAEEFDFYYENFYDPIRREALLSALKIEDIRFLTENTGVCLRIGSG